MSWRSLIIASTLVGCSTASRMEPPPLSTIVANGTPERKCDRPTTVFPSEARTMVWARPVRTTLSFEVLPAGQVGAVNVKKSSGSKALDKAAVEAIMKMHCAPLAASEKSTWLETWYEFKVE